MVVFKIIFFLLPLQYVSNIVEKFIDLVLILFQRPPFKRIK